MKVEETIERTPLVVVRDHHLDGIGLFPGWTGVSGKAQIDRLGRYTSTDPVPRVIAEESDGAIRQVATYAVIRTEGRQPEFFAYRRRGDGERGLHGRVSVGVGGHVEWADVPKNGPKDMRVARAFGHAHTREMREEVIIDPVTILNQQIVGVIRSNETPVERRHLGLVYLVRIKEGTKVYAKQNIWGFACMMSKSQLQDQYEYMEPWSRIVFDAIIK